MEIWYFLQIFWKDGLSKEMTLEQNLFLVLSGKMILVFLKISILFFRRKMKDHLPQNNTWKFELNWIFGKGVFLFPTNMILPSVIEAKMIFSRKIHLKMIFPASLKKMIFILENMISLLTEKLKMIKNFTQSNRPWEN